MKFRIVALVMALIASPAFADEKDKAMDVLAEATALESVCPMLTVSTDVARHIARLYKIDRKGADKITLQLKASKIAYPLYSEKQSEVCRMAITLYGPTGGKIPNLLHEK